jgi:hypothetical protein
MSPRLQHHHETSTKAFIISVPFKDDTRISHTHTQTPPPVMVFVARNETPLRHDADFCFTQEGEPVTFSLCCDDDDHDECGCQRAMTGLTTARATTVFTVAPFAGGEVGLRQAVRAHYQRTGWERITKADTFNAMIDEDVSEILRLAAIYPPGVILEKRGDSITTREGILEKWGICVICGEATTTLAAMKYRFARKSDNGQPPYQDVCQACCQKGYVLIPSGGAMRIYAMPATPAAEEGKRVVWQRVPSQQRKHPGQSNSSRQKQRPSTKKPSSK